MARFMTIVVFVFLFCPGCANIMADSILHAGSNRGGTPFPKKLKSTLLCDFAQGGVVRVQHDPPVDLMVWIVEPQHCQTEIWVGEKDAPPVPDGWVTEGEWTGSWPIKASDIFPGSPAVSLTYSMRWFTKDSTPDVTPIGTILLLNGQGGCARTGGLLFEAAYLTNAGYRVVMLDFRSQGDSTGKELGFVFKDAQDLSKVLDALEHGQLLTKPVGVMGHSYGAVSGGLATIKDPRISTAILSGTAMTWPDVIEHRLSQQLIWKLMPNFERERTFQICRERMGYDAFNMDGRKLFPLTTKPLLLLHGRNDNDVPIDHALALYQARPKNSRLVIFETSGHGDYFLTHFDEVRELCLSWFAEHMNEKTD